jgi:hypothetical protein
MPILLLLLKKMSLWPVFSRFIVWLSLLCSHPVFTIARILSVEVSFRWQGGGYRETCPCHAKTLSAESLECGFLQYNEATHISDYLICITSSM